MNLTYAVAFNGDTTAVNPATKLPHTESYLNREAPAELVADLAHCETKSKTRKRSVAKLMAEKGWTRAAASGPLAAQWVKA